MSSIYLVQARNEVEGVAWTDELTALLDQLTCAVASLQGYDLTSHTSREVLAAARQLEIARRRLDHATDRLAGHIDTTGAHGIDGHRTAKAALTHIGRLPAHEAHLRVRTAETMRSLPAVEAAYSQGEIPTSSMRAIVRLSTNPRVTDHLPAIDEIVADQASTDTHRHFTAWLRQLESLVDQDGADQDAEATHERRRATLSHNAIDGSWTLNATFGSLQGAAFANILGAFEHAELLDDIDAAKTSASQPDGTGSRPPLPRTSTQRRADALMAMASKGAGNPATSTGPTPLVNIVIDRETFEAELARLAGTDANANSAQVPRGDSVCQTIDGEPLHPTDALAAALVGHVRRVVTDTASNIIDLGRKRRLFTGSARDAALLQHAIHRKCDNGCLWPGCHAPPDWNQIDHGQPWRTGGGTDVDNSRVHCGHHNRLKETGYQPVHHPDGTWTFHRPDGTQITAAA